jgi:1-acyl-sn-glycerol-3-phosphate acyltransferase
VVAFPLVGSERRRALVRRWSRTLLDILAVRLCAKGGIPRRARAPLMLVANHVSWLDIIAINAVLPARFVAKSEIRTWPVIGWLSQRVGTFYIKRGKRRDAARINRGLADAMRNGDPVAFFPEGTTTDGSAVLPFHSSLMQAAVLASAPIHPVAIRYTRADGGFCVEAAYCGGTSLWGTLRRVVAEPGIQAELVFLPALASHDARRHDLAREARELILRSLFLPVPDSRAGKSGGLPDAVR